MLTPHNPSPNLRAPVRASVARPEDLLDVQITVVPYRNEPQQAPAARATPSGRAAAINARPPA